MQKVQTEKKIRRRIVEEKRQVAVVVESLVQSSLQCPVCREPSKMFSPLLAAKLLNISTREIYRRVEAGQAHFVELPDRQLFVCENVLKQK